MAPLTPDNTNRVAPATTEEEVATALQNDGVDYALLNALLLSIDTKLMTDSYGNFFIKGSHTANDGRHAQLREIFELKSLLEAVKALMERKTAAPSGEAVTESKRSGKFTSAQLAAIKNLVQQEQQAAYTNPPAAQLRALKDQMATTEAHLQKTEAENATLRQQIRDENSAVQESVQTESSALREKMQFLEAQVEAQGRDLWDLRKELFQLGQGTKQTAAGTMSFEEGTQEVDAVVKSSKTSEQGASNKAPADGDGSDMPSVAAAATDAAAEAVTEDANRRRETQAEICALSEAEILSRKNHIEEVRQKVRELSWCLEVGQAVVMHKKSGQLTSDAFRYGPDQDNTAVVGASAELYVILEVGDGIYLWKAEEGGNVEYQFARPIPETYLDKRDD